jgi:integrase/recombinase XerD
MIIGGLVLLLSKANEELKQHLVAKGRSKETVRGYTMDITMFDRYLSHQYNCPTYIEDITEDDIENYLRMLKDERHYEPASVNRHLNSIRVLCQLAYKKNWVKDNVSKGIEQLKCQKKERTYLTEEELTLLLDAIDHKLVHLVVQTLAYTGLRVSEGTNLMLDDVDFEHDLIHVVAGKGNKDRIVPINQSLKPLLLDYATNWRVSTTSSRFFATQKTGALSTQTINRVLHETTQKMGWKKNVTCHILRHSFASNLISKNVNIVKISKLLGHADVRTTSIYAHTNTRELSEAVNLL